MQLILRAQIAGILKCLSAGHSYPLCLWPGGLQRCHLLPGNGLAKDNISCPVCRHCLPLCGSCGLGGLVLAKVVKELMLCKDSV